MRALAILTPALLLGACQVTEDKGNNQVTVGYNQDVAEKAGATALNSVNEAGQAITNDAQKAGAAISNVDVDVKVGNKAAANNSVTTNTH